MNTKDSFCKTPLHNAILGEQVAIVDILLKSGADVKCQDEIGDTPLHDAVRVESLEIVEVRTSSSTKYLAICQLFSSQLCVCLSVFLSLSLCFCAFACLYLYLSLSLSLSICRLVCLSSL